MDCCWVIASSGLEGSVVLPVRESGEAKERRSIAGGVGARGPEGPIGETVVGPVEGHLVTILWGSLRFH
jgi:hypothetical protein